MPGSSPYVHKLLAAGARSRRRLIGLTPLIDVVFILLVFFMLASNLQRMHAIRLAAPADAVAAGSGEPAILVDIYLADIAVDGERMPLGAATDLVARRMGGANPPAVLVRPAEGVLLQRAVSVLDALGAAGAANVSFVNVEGP